MTKDTFIALFTKEIPRVLGALCQKWDENEIYFIINHNITFLFLYFYSYFTRILHMCCQSKHISLGFWKGKEMCSKCRIEINVNMIHYIVFAHLIFSTF